jgi:hypothetical protein
MAYKEFDGFIGILATQYGIGKSGFLWEAHKQDGGNKEAGKRLRKLALQVKKWAAKARVESKKHLNDEPKFSTPFSSRLLNSRDSRFWNISDEFMMTYCLPGQGWNWSYPSTTKDYWTREPNGPLYRSAKLLEKTLKNLALDAARAQEGNKSAGLRFRNKTYKVEEAAKRLRDKSLEVFRTGVLPSAEDFIVGNLVEVFQTSQPNPLGLVVGKDDRGRLEIQLLGEDYADRKLADPIQLNQAKAA